MWVSGIYTMSLKGKFKSSALTLARDLYSLDNTGLKIVLLLDINYFLALSNDVKMHGPTACDGHRLVLPLMKRRYSQSLL